MSDFTHVRVGDLVTRRLGGMIDMELIVTSVTNDTIACGGEGGWTFDRVSGAEIDDELGWGPKYGRTGSRLVGAKETE